MPGGKRIFYGWWIAITTAILCFFAGGTFFYGFTVFFNPIRDAFGWTATVTSVAFIFQRLEFGVLGPLAGFLVDRVGPKKLMLCGWSVVGLGFLLLSNIDTIWQYYGSFILIAAGMSFGSFVVTTTAIAQWFTRKRSRAMTLLSCGVGVSGILAPLLALSISQFGWRDTLVFVGVGLWVITLPLCLIMRDKPSKYGYLPNGETAATNGPTDSSSLRSPGGIVQQDSISSAAGFTATAALKTRAFWLLAFAFFFQHIATSAIMVHIVPYLESVRIPTTAAATAVTGLTLFSLVGRLGFGFLGDFANKRYLIAVALALQTIGVFVLSFVDSDRTWLVIPFLLIYAPGYGGPIPLRPALQADYFGTRSFGTILGLMAVVSMLGGLASPVLAGWIFDVMGSYRVAWQIFAFTTLPAIPLILLAKCPRSSNGCRS